MKIILISLLLFTQAMAQDSLPNDSFLRKRVIPSDVKDYFSNCNKEGGTIITKQGSGNPEGQKYCKNTKFITHTCAYPLVGGINGSVNNKFECLNISGKDYACDCKYEEHNEDIIKCEAIGKNFSFRSQSIHTSGWEDFKKSTCDCEFSKDKSKLFCNSEKTLTEFWIDGTIADGLPETKGVSGAAYTGFEERQYERKTKRVEKRQLRKEKRLHRRNRVQ